jgi:hypothetical protein
LDEEEEEGQRTPSKRRRISQRLEEGEDDVEMGSPSSSLARSSKRPSGPGLDRRVRRKASGRGRSSLSELEEDLPFVLLPLSRNVRQGAKTQEKQVEEGQAVIEQWLHVWGDWLDGGPGSQDSAAQ